MKALNFYFNVEAKSGIYGDFGTSSDLNGVTIEWFYIFFYFNIS